MQLVGSLVCTAAAGKGLLLSVHPRLWLNCVANTHTTAPAEQQQHCCLRATPTHRIESLSVSGYLAGTAASKAALTCSAVVSM